MPRTKTYHYFVANQLRYSGFPTDQLRYECARVLCHGLVAGRPGYIIEATRPPTGRWASFLWQVMPANRLEVVKQHGDTKWEEAWEVKMGSMWEVLKDRSTDNLPVYDPSNR